MLLVYGAFLGNITPDFNLCRSLLKVSSGVVTSERVGLIETGKPSGILEAMKKILFIHQNFPGQFKHLAPALVQRGYEVFALAMREGGDTIWQGVKVIHYTVSRSSTPNIHPWLTDFETKLIRAEAVFKKLRELRGLGIAPDLIISHPGWGESLFVKEVYPRVKLAVYCEFFYRATGADVGFDPEFGPTDSEMERCRLSVKNLNNILHFKIADYAWAPTKWQASTYPEEFRKKMVVIHDGIDTDVVVPNPGASITLQKTSGERITLTRRDEVVTFVNRNLEPYRGYHIFMRALPRLLRRRPRAQILIVGGSGVSYGSPPDPKRYGGLHSWKDIFINEVRPLISESDWRRVHFLGVIPYNAFLAVLQVSSVHVYLTYPFVLSWSLLEAMSAGCAVVGSNTPPVAEVITHDYNGRLVDFFDIEGLVEEIDQLLSNRDLRMRLARNARDFIVRNYDLKRVCLPKLIAFVENMLSDSG